MTRYSTIRESVLNGDVALWRSGGVLGRLEKWTHASRFFWFGNTLLLVEFREFRGCQVGPATEFIRRNPGSMCVYRPQCRALTRRYAAELMLRQTQKRYGYGIILKQLWQRANLLRLITGWSFEEYGTMPLAWDAPKDCSAAIVWSDRMAIAERQENVAHWPCFGRADWACAPKDLAADPFYEQIVSEVVM